MWRCITVQCTCTVLGYKIPKTVDHYMLYRSLAGDHHEVGYRDAKYLSDSPLISWLRGKLVALFSFQPPASYSTVGVVRAHMYVIPEKVISSF
jgi:hypothetical protein